MRLSITQVKMVRPKCHSYRLRIVFSQAEAHTTNRFKMFTTRPRTPVPKSICSAAARLALPPPVSSQGTAAALKNDIWAIKTEARATEISIDHPLRKESKLEIAKACKVKTVNPCNNQIVSDHWRIAAVASQALDRNRTQVEALGKINSSHRRLTSSSEKRETPAMQHQGVIREVQDLSSPDILREMASSRLTNLI